MLGVFWGTGVGGGIVLDGEVSRAAAPPASSGTRSIRRRGALCGCGNRGCVEAYAGRGQMEGWAARRHADGKHTDLFAIMRAARQGPADEQRLGARLPRRRPRRDRALERAADALGTGIASAINLLDLPAVVLGGGMGERFWQSHGPRDRRGRCTSTSSSAGDPPALLPRELGDDGGAIGAALLVAE